MAGFDKEQKNTSLYLDAAANGSGADKSWLTLEALRRLPAGTGPVDMVEIGPGGGVALESLTASVLAEMPHYIGRLSLSLVELDGIESEALRSARHSFNQVGISRLVRGDAREIDAILGPQSADIVTACAVYHEVYSYCGGQDALEDAFVAAHRTLKPKGYLAYRDVIAIARDTLAEQTTATYSIPSWVRFTKLFLPHYLTNATHPYRDYENSVKFAQRGVDVGLSDLLGDDALTMTAPSGLFRELQRHYITFRDRMWRSDVLGIMPVVGDMSQIDWIDQTTGHRRMHFKATDVMASYPTDEEGRYVLDGDEFEDMVDQRLDEVLTLVEDDEKSPAYAIWKEWLDREGCETYVYGTVDQLVGAMAVRTYESTEGKSLLLPQFVGISPRPHYTRYLSRRVPNAYYDGGQRILFQSLQPRKHTAEKETALDTVAATCSKETLATIGRLIQ
jgi:hypothetical protein